MNSPRNSPSYTHTKHMQLTKRIRLEFILSVPNGNCWSSFGKSCFPHLFFRAIFKEFPFFPVGRPHADPSPKPTPFLYEEEVWGCQKEGGFEEKMAWGGVGLIGGEKLGPKKP